MEVLIKNLNLYAPIPKALEREIEQVFQIKRPEKQTNLLKEGQTCSHFNFINKGLVRSYYYHDGKDKTYWFYDSGQFFTSWYSFYLQKPSFEYLEVLEDTEIFYIDYYDYQELARKFPAFGQFARCYAEIECANIDYSTKSYLDLSAKEKYQRLIEDIPDIISRVKLGHIASLLGISQETLSRIRAEKL